MPPRATPARMRRASVPEPADDSQKVTGTAHIQPLTCSSPGASSHTPPWRPAYEPAPASLSKNEWEKGRGGGRGERKEKNKNEKLLNCQGLSYLGRFIFSHESVVEAAWLSGVDVVLPTLFALDYQGG